ncbi:uncharacterized protein CPUR_04954 [Claviceps purpurea 20.1]|uniref:Uncharacterized protein n=1 Tax=Claviceps purpurea (strain 20.1) TaxID=1111077 RepID=M1WBK4_CLAP2|nr:uncharacterized protein CPUR_04954 [Claviceps purpurea 20.1]
MDQDIESRLRFHTS